jgi:BolA family transcriptional regulator, general stress-responsive regulator
MGMTLAVLNAAAELCSASAIEAHLREQFAPDFLQVIDESAAHAGHVGASDSGQGTHMRIRIAGSALVAKNRVAQHRLVYDALVSYFDQGLHALAIEILN